MVHGMHVANGVALGHLVHYSLLAVGLAGLVALLGPQFDRGSRRASVPRDDHERQVAALRVAMAGASGASGATLTRPPAAPVEIEPEPGSSPSFAPSLTMQLLLPLAVVSSGAAALAHAAVAPEHFEERTLFGLFFATSALAQLAWCAAVTRRATPGLLWAGALGNAGVLALWAVTRTVGLPLGLMPEPEAVGPWDLACLGWELVVILVCAVVLLRGRRPHSRLPGWPDWHTGAVLWLMASILVLGGLNLIGHSA